ncbi:MAG: phosphate signaling complex protein PhoU [bacterium]|jgi:phosphate transport system protein|nr:phosphate signaling complex protein PhoU [bacterium]MDD3805795.1 phosphate signaling complex protein PhoU [bacterium]MDD4557603.1 phosphate signaling complex protein PhoU [bacterium]
MTESIRKTFDEQLSDMQQEIVCMGSMVEQMVHHAIKALSERDIELAERVIRMDDAVDDLDISIEGRCMRMLALQQPVARDLRTIGTSMKIITDLERMGDHAVDIAKLARTLAEQPLFKPIVDIPKMAAVAQKMLRESLQAFVNRDIDLVQKMVADDDAVDALYRRIYDEIVDYMEKDPGIIRQAIILLRVARFLERIADHATNIGERVIFMETGVLEELNI